MAVDIKQVASIMNTVANEILGAEAIVAEDLSNIVDIGKEIFDNTSVDVFTKKLVNHIGRVMVVDRIFKSGAPNVFRDGWEYGSVLEKISFELPEAEDNPKWNLVDGQSYDPHKFYAPKVEVKFFNQKETFQLPYSITDDQIKASFSSAMQVVAFVSGLETAVENGVTIRIMGLIERAINNMIGETMYAQHTDGTYTGNSTATAVNVLHLYNTEYAQTLTPENCLKDKEFLRFMSETFGKYIDYLKTPMRKFNQGGKPRQTPRELLHFVVLSDVEKAAEYSLYSDTWHNQFVSLPYHEVVPFWQAPGDGPMTFANNSELHITTASGHEVQPTGVLAVMFDHDAVMVTNQREETPSQYTPNAHFTTFWRQVDCGIFNDLDENFVVFYVA